MTTVLLVATATAATAVTAPPSLALAALALATAPTVVGGGGWARGRRTGRRGSGSSESRGRGLLACSAEAEFLDAEHVGGRLEVGKWRRVGDDVGGVGEARVEAAQKVQHKLCRRYGVTNLPQGVGGKGKGKYAA
jgi:hypothetical protein